MDRDNLEYMKQWREENKERVKEYKRQYRLSNREARNEYNRRYYETHAEYREHVRARTSEYSSTHADMRCELKSSRRARERNAYVAPVNRQEVFERDNWICQLCSDPIDRDASFPHPLSVSLDHIIPLAGGGTHEPGNSQCAHLRCNVQKKDKVGETSSR